MRHGCFGLLCSPEPLASGRRCFFISETWVSSKLVDASVLKQGIEQHGMAAGSAKNYDAMLVQADNWLPGQLEKLIEEQAARREALRTPTEPLAAELTTCPSGEVIPVDGSAKHAFQQPMECTPHLIALFK